MGAGVGSDEEFKIQKPRGSGGSDRQPVGQQGRASAGGKKESSLGQGGVGGSSERKKRVLLDSESDNDDDKSLLPLVFPGEGAGAGGGGGTLAAVGMCASGAAGLQGGKSAGETSVGGRGVKEHGNLTLKEMNSLRKPAPLFVTMATPKGRSVARGSNELARAKGKATDKDENDRVRTCVGTDTCKVSHENCRFQAAKWH